MLNLKCKNLIMNKLDSFHKFHYIYATYANSIMLYLFILEFNWQNGELTSTTWNNLDVVCVSK